MAHEPSANFAFLAYHDPRLVAVATAAERLFPIDAAACLTKLRLFLELLVKHASARMGLSVAPDDSLLTLIHRLHDERAIDARLKGLMNDLRRVANTAAHEGNADHGETLHQLKIARELAVWFQRTYGSNRKFTPPPFTPPAGPTEAPAVAADRDNLEAELAALRAEAQKHHNRIAAALAEAEAARKQAQDEAERRLTAEQLAQQQAEERALVEALGTEAEQALQALRAKSATERARLEAQLAAAQAEVERLANTRALGADLAQEQRAAAEASPEARAALVQQAEKAADAVSLDEAATRRTIDKQLQGAGWEADSEHITYAGGVRPLKGRNLAIAEWPTASGPADYVLFTGLQAVGVVEAKRKAIDIPGAIQQAKRYSCDYVVKADEQIAGGPWGKYRVPFLFATNGRPYLRLSTTCRSETPDPGKVSGHRGCLTAAVRSPAGDAGPATTPS